MQDGRADRMSSNEPTRKQVSVEFAAVLANSLSSVLLKTTFGTAATLIADLAFESFKKARESCDALLVELPEVPKA